jgi:Uma2 family endonuclease
MIADTKHMTYEEFLEISEGLNLEFINGEVIEMPPARASHSEVHDRLVFLVRLHCRDNNLSCHTSSADGTFNIMGNVFAPDFAYKPTPMSDDYPDMTPPTWVAEIISPTDKRSDIERKRGIYIKAGILLIEAYPQIPAVDVYAPGQSEPQHYRVGDTIDLESVLKGFKLNVRQLFE